MGKKQSIQKKDCRQRYRLDYYYEGQKICRDTFMYIQAVFKNRLAALVKHYLQMVLAPGYMEIRERCLSMHWK